MPLRSMTGFAQIKGQVNAQLAFALSLKSVNHRFLDLHFRMPSDTDALEMKLRRMLKDKLARGHDLLLDIDVQGASKIKEKIPKAVSIFILPPDREKLEWRLRHRGLDSEAVIRRRLDTARREIENYSKYDYILVNNLLEQSADELKDIVLAERLRQSGSELSGEEKQLIEIAQACRLEQARERVQPILASFRRQ